MGMPVLTSLIERRGEKLIVYRKRRAHYFSISTGSNNTTHFQVSCTIESRRNYVVSITPMYGTLDFAAQSFLVADEGCPDRALLRITSQLPNSCQSLCDPTYSGGTSSTTHTDLILTNWYNNADHNRPQLNINRIIKKSDDIRNLERLIERARVEIRALQAD